MFDKILIDIHVDSNEVDSNNEGLPAVCLQPKHAHIPDIALDSNLLFEAMVFVFCVMALGMQYINLYKTVWWLPHSNANYALVRSYLNANVV